MIANLPALVRIFGVAVWLLAFPSAALAAWMGDAVDVSREFEALDPVYYMADQVAAYDPVTGKGSLQWTRHRRQLALSFNKLDRGFARAESSDFPGTEYDEDPVLPFSIVFVGPRTVRLRLYTRAKPAADMPSLMLVDGGVSAGAGWELSGEDDMGYTYTGAYGSVRVSRRGWGVEVYDASGRLVTCTQRHGEVSSFVQPLSTAFIRRASDLGHSMAASFRLAHDEKLYGCGESFTRLDKRGQKAVAYLRDGMGAQSERMYKPIPFFLSDRGYGMFVHTSAPVTFDFGKTFDQFATVYTGDDQLDLFFFLGEPKEILSAYTELTGRARMPPLWSFGLWMSRITYKSEAEVRAVAARLRELAIPCDVIHLDTGWFETDWQCDYQFSPSRFPNPAGMISDLRGQGFRISLWQYPYFTAKNRLYDEIVANGYHVRDQGGTLPAEDAVLDFSNPEAVVWYQGLLEGLLKQGVGAIKVDFGEDAPWNGVYASGRTGYYEHNLYPLRYNRAAAEITRRVTGEDIIWARSAWAGSQRYPLHWGGDAENTDSAMAATLRGGLSFGMSGFTFWSHDAGGFVNPPPRDLYHRWLAFAALSSHTRCHGAPPREPWEFDEAFVGQFRDIINLRYSLLPYLYAQGMQSAQQGWPVLRPLFHEFPDDPASWLIEDQYLLGSDLLVAPLFEPGGGRQVYLPPGKWYDYQSGRPYAGGRWHPIEAAPLPIAILARDHAAIPCIAVAPSTDDLDWSRLDLRVFDSDGTGAKGLVCLPDGELHPLAVAAGATAPTGAADPLPTGIRWNLVRTGAGTP